MNVTMALLSSKQELIWAAKLFRPYSLGHNCIVYTDHSACTSLLGTRHPSAKLARWAMIIQEIKQAKAKAKAEAKAKVIQTSMLYPGIPVTQLQSMHR